MYYKWKVVSKSDTTFFSILFENYIPYNIYAVFRILGRLSFPLYVYALSLGVQKTSNILRIIYLESWH